MAARDFYTTIGGQKSGSKIEFLSPTHSDVNHVGSSVPQAFSQGLFKAFTAQTGITAQNYGFRMQIFTKGPANSISDFIIQLIPQLATNVVSLKTSQLSHVTFFCYVYLYALLPSWSLMRWGRNYWYGLPYIYHYLADVGIFGMGFMPEIFTHVSKRQFSRLQLTYQLFDVLHGFTSSNQ